MRKRTIFIGVLVAVVALLGFKVMFQGETLPLANGPASEDYRPRNPPATEPSPKMNQLQKPDIAPNAEAPAKLASTVVAGGRPWKLNFADKTLPAEAKNRITYDLNVVLAHLPKFEVDTLPFPIEVDGKQLDRRVRFEGEGRKWNNVLQSDSFGCLFSGEGVEALFIPEPVIAAYSKAMELEKQNPAAYQQLDRFLARMSELKERPADNVRDFFVLADEFKSAEADLAAVTPAGFVEGWGGKRYREPSILDVSQTAGTPLEKYGSLVATTYAMSSGKMDDLPLLVFNQGRWRFLLQRPPT